MFPTSGHKFLIPIKDQIGNVRFRWIEARTGYKQRHSGVIWASCQSTKTVDFNVSELQEPQLLQIAQANLQPSFEKAIKKSSTLEFSKPCTGA